MIALLALSYWVTWFPGACVALIALLALIWRGLRLIFRLEAALPTLLGIADQFKPNGGQSLHDQLGNLFKKLDEHTQQDTQRFDKLERHLIRQDDSTLTPQVAPESADKPTS